MAKARSRKAQAAQEEAPDLGHIAEQLRALAQPIGTLVLDPANARKHPEKNLAAIRGSLRVYGQRKPLIVHRTTRVVLAGNGTLLAAQGLGWTHLAVVEVEDDAATAAGFAIADNRTAELAEWDEQALAALLGTIDVQDEDLAAMLDGLREEHAAAEAPAEEAAPAAAEEPAALQHKIVIDCADEVQQAELLDRLTAEGLTCKALII